MRRIPIRATVQEYVDIVLGLEVRMLDLRERLRVPGLPYRKETEAALKRVQVLHASLEPDFTEKKA